MAPLAGSAVLAPSWAGTRQDDVRWTVEVTVWSFAEGGSW